MLIFFFAQIRTPVVACVSFTLNYNYWQLPKARRRIFFFSFLEPMTIFYVALDGLLANIHVAVDGIVCLPYRKRGTKVMWRRNTDKVGPVVGEKYHVFTNDKDAYASECVFVE